jgi:hypothetical protein
MTARWLRPEIVRFVSIVSLVMIVAATVIMFATNGRGGTLFGPPLGGDYPQFYTVGLLQNEYGAARLYDLEFQDRILHEVAPAFPAAEHLPYVYPPFLAPLFRPLARLPYAWSFATWFALTAALYGVAIALMLKSCTSIPRHDRTTVWLLALSFEPFAAECWLGGQLSAIGCLAIAICLVQQRKGRPILAGLALALLCYKPPLLLLILPFLIVSRQWRVCAGFTAGAVAFAALSWWVVGSARCEQFARLMTAYGHQGGSVGAGFRTVKYVDLGAFLSLLGIAPGLVGPLAITLALPALGALIAAWYHSGRRSGIDLDLAWAATLCWTPVLSVYGPAYDAVLIVPGLLLAGDALRQKASGVWPPAFLRMLALLYVAAWLSPSLARGIGFQSLTVGLAAVGAYLIRAALKEDLVKLPPVTSS